MIPSTDRTVVYFSFRFFFSVNDTILTQPEPKKEWLRQQHHMGEVQTDFHPCDAVLSTGIQVKPLPFCFSTFLPFLLFWIKFTHKPSRTHSNSFTGRTVPQPKIYLDAEVFVVWGFFCFFIFCLAPKKKERKSSYSFFWRLPLSSAGLRINWRVFRKPAPMLDFSFHQELLVGRECAKQE